jgi:hypothetical protein
MLRLRCAPKCRRQVSVVVRWIEIPKRDDHRLGLLLVALLAMAQVAVWLLTG